MTVHIQVATDADAGDVVALLARQLEDHGVPLTRTSLAAAVTAVLVDASKGTILLARHEGAAAGIACLARTFTLEHGGEVWWLDELYVIPELRSQGIGKALLDQATALARGSGALAMELEVEADHGRAAHLYARAGFHTLARQRWSLSLK